MITQLRPAHLIVYTLLIVSGITVFAKTAVSYEYHVPEITQAQYDQFQKDSTPTFLAYNATWCPSCRKQNKNLAALRPDYEAKAAIYTVDIDRKKEYDLPFPIRRTTIFYIVDGVVVDELLGATSKVRIKAFLDKNLANN